MITVDMGAITETLFESELFGYVRGAFTDAKGDKPGKMELAEGSTLFLDEIGNLSYPLQAKLLTALQRRTITRLGGTKEIPINIRLISATNRNLQDMVREGTFREDLLYRMNTICLHLPPLRERKDEIIPADEAQQIFVPFFTTKPTGSGIGLSISRQIMKQSGGSLELIKSDTTSTLFRLKF